MSWDAYPGKNTADARWGEVVDINMPRDKATGKAKGFAFVMYEDQRSTVLAVDNMNGSQVLGRTLRVCLACSSSPGVPQAFWLDASCPAFPFLSELETSTAANCRSTTVGSTTNPERRTKMESTSRQKHRLITPCPPRSTVS